MKCRFCKNNLENEFIDLGNSPPSNSYLKKHELNEPEVFYPLKVLVCKKCWLVQIDEYKKTEEIFNSDYAYFSSFSTSWLKHCSEFANIISKDLHLNENSLVVEIASNDGYLLQYFKEKGIPVLGIEPTENTAKVAIDKGIETIVEFFGVKLAEKLITSGQKADLICGNNVLAHVPDINDFVGGLSLILKEKGTITMEFPHLFQLVKNNQFDTIYHEHFSYLSLTSVNTIFDFHNLNIHDVEEITTHGGSIRIHASHKNLNLEKSSRYLDLLQREKNEGLESIEYYTNFQKNIAKIKLDLISFLIEQKRNGKTVAAYGAAAKGNTLLNHCGLKNDLIEFVVDANPFKQNKYLPASHIPIVEEKVITQNKPDFILILPWNIKDEIIEQLAYVKEWDAKFVIPIPSLKII